MRLFTDWKYIATLAATIAGVIVPLWIWQYDLSPKQITVNVKTKIPLQPTDKEPLDGLEILIDGKKVENPYLTVLEINNNGSKPIIASEFEYPLEISLTSKTLFVRSKISDKNPKDIDTKITNEEKQKITIKPALLNPKEYFRTTIITSGDAPEFEAKARIVGISSIPITDETTKKTNNIFLSLLGLIVTLLTISWWIVSDGAFSNNGIHLRQRAAIFISLSSFIPCGLLTAIFLNELGIINLWYSPFAYLLLLIPAAIIAKKLNRHTEIAN